MSLHLVITSASVKAHNFTVNVTKYSILQPSKLISVYRDFIFSHSRQRGKQV